MKTIYLQSLLVILVCSPLRCVSQSSSIACPAEIEGCGITVGGGTRGLFCVCVEHLDKSLAFATAIYCALDLSDPGPLCCPCDFVEAASLTADHRLDCAKKTDLRRLERLVNRSRRLGQKIARKCPYGIVDGCVSRRILRKVDSLSCQITEISTRIEADCMPKD